jgi:hypothetical protein
VNEDSLCYYLGELEREEYHYGKDCSICRQMIPYENNSIYIKVENGYIVGNGLMRKVYLKKKPDYISFEQFTESKRYVKDLATGTTSAFYLC